jgi:hypothetical protein
MIFFKRWKKKRKGLTRKNNKNPKYNCSLPITTQTPPLSVFRRGKKKNSPFYFSPRKIPRHLTKKSNKRKRTSTECYMLL